MVVLRAGLGLLVASLLQVLIHRVGGQFGVGLVVGVDLLLVVVVWIALSAGPVTGQLVGMLAGFLSDGLSGAAFGLHAVADTLIGYLAAEVRQRVVLQRSVFVLMFAAGAAIQQILIITLLALFVSEPELPSWFQVGMRILATGLFGAFLLTAEGRVHKGLKGWKRHRRSRLR